MSGKYRLCDQPGCQQRARQRSNTNPRVMLCSNHYDAECAQRAAQHQRRRDDIERKLALKRQREESEAESSSASRRTRSSDSGEGQAMEVESASSSAAAALRPVQMPIDRISAELLGYITASKAELELDAPDAVKQLVADFTDQRDFRNDYGMAFVNLLYEPVSATFTPADSPVYLHQLLSLAITRRMRDLNNTVGADEGDTGLLLWHDIVASTKALSGGAYQAVAIESHSSSILQRLPVAFHIAEHLNMEEMPQLLKPLSVEATLRAAQGEAAEQEDDDSDTDDREERKGAPVSGMPLTADELMKRCATVIIFPRSYYARDYSDISRALRTNEAKPTIVRMETDPSHPIERINDFTAATALSEKENDALESINAFIRHMRRGVSKRRIRSVSILIEPILIPGHGNFYSPRFLRELQNIRDRLKRVFIIADESLSSFRCGYNLYSQSPALRAVNWRPDFIMIGKGLYCSLLLARADDACQWATEVASGMSVTVSSTAEPARLVQCCLTLRYLIQGDVAKRCREQSAALIAAFREHLQIDCAGVGFALFSRQQRRLSPVVPIRLIQPTRLLPRLDQTPEAVSRLPALYARIKELLDQRSPALSYRQQLLDQLYYGECSLCNIGVLEDGSALFCPNCPRQYHYKCMEDASLPRCVCGHDSSQSSASQSSSSSSQL